MYILFTIFTQNIIIKCNYVFLFCSCSSNSIMYAFFRSLHCGILGRWSQHPPHWCTTRQGIVHFTSLHIWYPTLSRHPELTIGYSTLPNYPRTVCMTCLTYCSVYKHVIKAQITISCLSAIYVWKTPWNMSLHNMYPSERQESLCVCVWVRTRVRARLFKRIKYMTVRQFCYKNKIFKN